MDRTRLAYLYQRYQAKQLTAAEQEEWEAIVSDLSQEEALQQLIDVEWQGADERVGVSDPDESERIYRYIISHRQQKRSPKLVRHWLRYAGAAIILLGIGLLLLPDETHDGHQEVVQHADILPGGNKAVLTLADGRIIDLDSSQSGIIVGNQITYESGDTVVSVEDGPQTDRNLRLTTPKGGIYQITLSDGTKVWLNAESTLQYPAQFAKDKRMVFLTGEGYFDVAKDSKRSFVVATDGQAVQVLGTQFNVTAYPNELQTKTTLIEGKVRVSNMKSGIEHVLMPGQQGITADDDTEVKNVATEQFTAWKDGYFRFDETPFPEVLEQLARWYDIEIVYQKTPTKTFSGKMKRDARFSSVLDFLEGSGIRFRLDGNKLTIN